MLRHSPLALRCLKASLNADCDGQMGLLDLAGNATLLYYMSEEAKEGKNAFVENALRIFQIPQTSVTSPSSAPWHPAPTMKAPPGTAPPAGNPCATCRNMKTS